MDRKNQIRLLESAVREAADGAARIVLVEGVVGCGKTELIESVTEIAARSGLLVLRAEGTRAERDIPFGVIGQLTAAAPEDAFDAVPPAPEATAGAGRVAARQAFATAVQRLAERTPVAICVDDLHLVDEPSRHYLLHLAGRLRQARVLLVLAESPHERTDDPELGTDLLRRPGFARIRLEPLTRQDVEATLERAGVTRPGAAEAHALSGGNPLLLRALTEDGGPGRAFVQAFLACLRRCGSRTEDVAGAVAVLGTLAAPSSVAALLDLPEGEVQTCLDALGLAGLLDGTAFRHPAARTAVLDHLDGGVRARRHLTAAELAHAQGHSATDVAAQLLTAGVPAPAWAGPVLRAAADRLLADGEHRRALECLEAALAGTDDPAQSAELRTALAAAVLAVDPAAAEAQLTEPLAAVRAGRLPAPVAARLARLLVTQGRIDETAEVLQELGVNAEAGEGGSWDDPRRGPLDGLSAFPHWSPRPAPPITLPRQREPTTHRRPAPAGTVAPAATVTHPAPAPQGPGWAAAFWGVPEWERSTRAVESAEALLRRTSLAESTLAPVLQALRALLHLDGPRRALPWTQTCLDEAARRGAPGWQAVFALTRAEVLLRQGDLPGAEELALQARASVPEHDDSLFHSWAGATLAAARTPMGRHDDAGREVCRPQPERLAGSLPLLAHLKARGAYYFATNRYQAALADYLDIGRAMRRWGIDRPVVLPWRTYAADALLQLGEVRQASRLVADQLASRDVAHPWVNGLTLRLKAALGPPAERPALLARSVDELRRSGDRLELARAMADLGETFKECGDPARANMVNRRAWHLAKECGAQTLRERILPGRAGAVEPADGSRRTTHAELDAKLSESEKRVALLAVHGHTNREIALKLYITVSTVEQHLTRVYRKLNITRRQDLPVDLPFSEALDLA
ncbi:helix-turn-helix transcriptional regulator [Streptomyces sp. HUAS TT20]|uniref:helix-turn-helix transcriptional regulator n=1 Tax=Streptomyces sp. HUAS TT20 TaxID=3447509 RepID=UPI0021DA4CB5|nr:AAA family ATPase [Streptomyces sp. HUAS 15-9]UXY30514.1 AAA family ATPase [Streptomyces sp. HUAS 15-9]